MKSVNHISVGEIDDSEDIQAVVKELQLLLELFGSIKVDITAVKGSVPEWYKGVAVASHGIDQISEEDVCSEVWKQIEDAKYLFDGLEEDYRFFHEPEVEG